MKRPRYYFHPQEITLKLHFKYTTFKNFYQQRFFALDVELLKEHLKNKTIQDRTFLCLHKRKWPKKIMNISLQNLEVMSNATWYHDIWPLVSVISSVYKPLETLVLRQTGKTFSSPIQYIQ